MASEDPFAPAQKIAAKAKIAVVGVAGSGKTYTAMLIARGLSPDGTFVVGDAEGGRASWYADEFAFGMVKLNAPFTAGKLKKLVDQAVEHGKHVLLIDGISPWWSGDGGILATADANKKGDASGGWLTARPLQKMIEGVIDQCPIHVICTVRAKQHTDIQTINGKQRPVKLGMKPEMADDMGYVFDYMFSVEHADHTLVTTKTRWKDIDSGEIPIDISAEVAPAEQMARDLRAWLEEGTAPAAPAPPPDDAPGMPDPETAALEDTPEPSPAPPAAAPKSADAAPAAPPAAVEPAAETPAGELAASALTRPQIEAGLRVELTKITPDQRQLVKEACKTLSINWGAGTPAEIVDRFYGAGCSVDDVIGALLTAGTPPPSTEAEPPWDQPDPETLEAL
jgi:hypothetical protein